MSTPEVQALDEPLAAQLLPQRDPLGHKGTFGRILAVAGSLDYAGAALMAGAAALRAGCGLVTLCLPASLQPSLAGRVPELITLGLPERADGTVDVEVAAALIEGSACDALLIGPGLRPDRPTSRLVQRVLATEGPPAVVDAGALGVLAGVPGWPARLARPCVLTPHPGEFARLGHDPGDDDAARAAAAVHAAATWGQVLVLKGAHSVVAATDGSVRVARFELPALGSGGTGDVLAGIVASLLGQGLDRFDAASLGVYLHARAGEHVSETLGDAGLMATDLLPVIPRVRRHLASVRARGRGGRLGFESRLDPAG